MHIPTQRRNVQPRARRHRVVRTIVIESKHAFATIQLSRLEVDGELESALIAANVPCAGGAGIGVGTPLTAFGGIVRCSVVRCSAYGRVVGVFEAVVVVGRHHSRGRATGVAGYRRWVRVGVCGRVGACWAACDCTCDCVRLPAALRRRDGGLSEGSVVVKGRCFVGWNERVSLAVGRCGSYCNSACIGLTRVDSAVVTLVLVVG